MTNSRQKGARAERLLSHLLTDLGFPARRGQQFSGANGDADVVSDSLSHLWIEVKNVQRLNVSETYFGQATRDASKVGKTPMVFHKKDRTPFLVTMSLEDWAVREKAYIKEMNKDDV